MTLFLASTVLAAYEFYIVQLTAKGPIDWALAAKEIGSVKGVERTQVDRERGVVTITCSSQCDGSVLNGVQNKLKAKGIEQKIINKPASSSTAGRVKATKGDSLVQGPALKLENKGNVFPKVENEGKIFPKVENEGKIFPKVENEGKIFPKVENEGKIFPKTN
jgi:hypothetical protein